MSRSRKKYGVLKDKGLSRQEYSKMLRRVNNQRIKQSLEPKLMYEVVDSYDVCDYEFWWGPNGSYSFEDFQEAESKKAYEKRKRSYFGK